MTSAANIGAPKKSREFVQFEGECWLGKRLGVAGPLFVPEVFYGSTTAEQRRESIRARILERGPDKVCGHKKGREVTYRQAFEQLYGEPL